ncbi:acetylornithine transaminase [Flaviflexus massiliensis]|uniref:acetylornithine transaminase n=1 Tax=Flaviflexus massiliensis TaxID=1522309 RepID=UPI0006D5B583|nr:acetylornithine transaminase [Flaviflexus massiliensis]
MTISTYESVYINAFGTPSLVLDHGQGVHVWDTEGKKYLDLLAGIAVNALGYADQAMARAITDQVSKLSHVSNFFTTEPQINLAKKLVELLVSEGGRPGKVFLANSGTEANEGAMKLAMLHKPGGKIVALEGAFHGRTLGALSITHKPAIREPFGQIPGCEFIVPEVEALAGLGDDVAAIFLEPIQGERGVMPLSEEFLQEARATADRIGALLVVDEIQTGMGRTGRWFAHTASVQADVITLAKGLGGGMPIGAIIATGEAANLFTPGSHGSTFGGNPVAAAAALAVLDRITELLPHVGDMGEWIMGELNAAGFEVRGRGLLLGVTVNDAPGLVTELRKAGFIVNATGPDTLRLAPPLIISRDEFAPFVQALSELRK